MSVYWPRQRSPERGVVGQGRSQGRNGSPSLQAAKGGASSAPKTELGVPRAQALPPCPPPDPEISACEFLPTNHGVKWWRPTLRMLWLLGKRSMGLPFPSHGGRALKGRKAPRARPPQNTPAHAVVGVPVQAPTPSPGDHVACPHQLSGRGDTLTQARPIGFSDTPRPRGVLLGGPVASR